MGESHTYGVELGRFFTKPGGGMKCQESGWFLRGREGWWPAGLRHCLCLDTVVILRVFKKFREDESYGKPKPGFQKLFAQNSYTFNSIFFAGLNVSMYVHTYEWHDQEISVWFMGVFALFIKLCAILYAYFAYKVLQVRMQTKTDNVFFLYVVKHFKVSFWDSINWWNFAEGRLILCIKISCDNLY